MPDIFRLLFTGRRRRREDQDLYQSRNVCCSSRRFCGGASASCSFRHLVHRKKIPAPFRKEAFDVVDLSLDGLLYDTYGCGVTLIVLYALILSLKSKERRGLTSAVLICFLIPAVSFVLSGFLYARSKTLIPFLPLLILLFSLTVEDVRVKKTKNLL